MRPALLAALLCTAAFGQTWAVDPNIPGPDVPPAGKSLFDQTAPSPLPFPFAALIASMQVKLGHATPLRRILIPLGRSLQRNTAAPDFFLYPRAVAAFGDRLFLGYQEKAGIIEVLSYNEDAGRFEFQLVQNYRAGGKAETLRAQRKVCTRCHQNHAPIFPRQLWDETNANAGIRQLLRDRRAGFYGFPLAVSADVPYQIDQAIHRANMYSVVQRIWSANADLRGAWLSAALQFRLGGEGDFDRRSAAYLNGFRKLLLANWRGLWIPNPEIADRSPLAPLSRTAITGAAAKLQLLIENQRYIDPAFEPAIPRAPLEIWLTAEPDRPEELVAALANFFTDEDIAALKKARRAVLRPPAALVTSTPFRPHAIARALLDTHLPE